MPWYPILCKAVFEKVKPSDLETATELVAEVDDYALAPEMSGSEDYAREYRSRLKGGMSESTCPSWSTHTLSENRL